MIPRLIPVKELQNMSVLEVVKYADLETIKDLSKTFLREPYLVEDLFTARLFD